MSKEKKLRPEDRILTSLKIIRWKCVDLIGTIDEEMDYIESIRSRYEGKNKK